MKRIKKQKKADNHMELVESRNHVENPSETAALREALKKVMEKNADGGELTLNEFTKLVPKANRNEAVKVLKKSKEGVFITGRRGRQSRFVYGPPAIPFISKMAPRQSQAPRSRSQQERESHSVSVSESGTAARFELRVNVGGQVTSIPINIELAVAA